SLTNDTFIKHLLSRNNDSRYGLDKIEFAQYQQMLNFLFKKRIERIICIDDKNYSHYHYFH
ncbi:hypothetical protein, partial [Klebsiella pneumoniae]|uniref:hypothetical protein n=1 Tax=Klebsiella pneumoniae TaxID=573 RepID=UPI001C6F8C0E